MSKFVSLKEINKSEKKVNVYLSDGFTTKYSIHNMVGKNVVERGRVIIAKRDLKGNDKR